MNTVPEGWTEAALVDVTTKIGSGSTPKGGHAAYHAAGIPLIRSMNIHFAGFSDEGLAFLDESQANKLSGAIVESDDVLLNITGASIGRVTIAPRRMEGARVNQHVAIIRSIPGIEPAFVMRYLASPALQRFIVEENYGVTRQALTKGMIENIKIPVAPLAEQKRIVAKIDSLFSQSKRAREHLDHLPRLVEKYKQAVLAAAFRGDLTKGWRKQQPLPLWKSSTVAEVADIVFDGPFGSNLKSSDYSERGVRVVRLENIGHLRFIGEKETFIPTAKFQGLKRHTLVPGDILFSSFVADEVRVCLFPRGLTTPAINKADCFCIRVNPERCMPEFLVFRLASKTTFDDLEAAVHGATRPRISLSQLREYQFDLPTLAEQNKIVRRIDQAFAWIDRLASEAGSAHKLIDRLDHMVLAKAFRGQLVPHNPTDEPASVLLERVKSHLPTQSNFGLSTRKSQNAQIKDRTKKVRVMSKKRRSEVDQSHIYKTLVALGGSAKAKAVWQKSEMEIDEFYKQLRNEITAGYICEGESKDDLVAADET